MSKRLETFVSENELPTENPFGERNTIEPELDSEIGALSVVRPVKTDANVVPLVCVPSNSTDVMPVRVSAVKESKR